MNNYTHYNNSQNQIINKMMPCPYSERELEVLTLVCNFHNAKEISKLLSISHGTVKRHIENMRNKTGCRNVLELAIGAIGSKWISIQ